MNRLIDALMFICIMAMVLGVLFGSEYNLFHAVVVILLTLNLYKKVEL